MEGAIGVATHHDGMSGTEKQAVRHCLPLDPPLPFRCLSTAFSLPFLDVPPPFHCLSTASP